MLKKYSGKLYCFSPPVMLATFLIEFGLAFYTLWRYKMTEVSRLVVAMLFLLGTFQLAEYMVCGGLGISVFSWAQVGYMSITLLPALGIHLVTAIAGKKTPVLVGTAYATAAAFATWFALTPDAINAHECRPNYAVFHLDALNQIVFALYYYGWLLIGVYLAWYWTKGMSQKKAKALYAMMAGYLVFIVPTTAANLVDPSTIAGIPSIMCGFAVLLAVILVMKVLPETTKERVEHHGSWRLWQS